MAIQKQLAFVLLVILCTESLATREPINLLNTTRQLSHRFPIIEVTDHHIATAHFLDDAVSVKTYSLEGQELTSCEAPRVWPNSLKYIGLITSLGNNETLVLSWIITDRYHTIPPIVFVSTINTTDCKFTFKDISTILNNFERGIRKRPFLVPYVDSFDLVFENKDHKTVKIRFAADGLVKENPVEMAVIESRSMRRIYSVPKYSESKGYLAINHDEEGFTAISVDSAAKLMKRKTLIQMSKSEIIKKGFSPSIKVDHGKLVFCSYAEETINCTRYNAATLESEISTQFEVTSVDGVLGKILILPDGGFWIWAILALEPDSEEFDMKSSLFKVDVDGRIQETFNISHCETDKFTAPHLYYMNEKICIAHVCESFGPPDSQGNWLYSSQATCY